MTVSSPVPVRPRAFTTGADCRSAGVLMAAMNLLDEGRVVASAAPVQQRHDLSCGQLLAELGRWGCRQDGQGSLVLEVRRRLQGLGIELQQHRTESAYRLVQRPDRLLVLPGQGFHRPAFVADRRERSVLVAVVAQDVGQGEGVAGVGLPARPAVPLAVARDSPRVDRVDRQACGLQGHHDQVLVGLDRDRDRTERAAHPAIKRVATAITRATVTTALIVGVLTTTGQPALAAAGDKPKVPEVTLVDTTATETSAGTYYVTATLEWKKVPKTALYQDCANKVNAGGGGCTGVDPKTTSFTTSEASQAR